MYSETVQLARQLKAIDDSGVAKSGPVLAPPTPRLGTPGGR